MKSSFDFIETPPKVLCGSLTVTMIIFDACPFKSTDIVEVSPLLKVGNAQLVWQNRPE